MRRKTEVSNLFILQSESGLGVNSLDNDLLELSVELGGHLTLSNVSKELLLGGLEVLLD